MYIFIITLSYRRHFVRFRFNIKMSIRSPTFGNSRKQTVHKRFEERLGLRLRFRIVRRVSGFNSGTGCTRGSFPARVSLRRHRNRYLTLLFLPVSPIVSDVKPFLYVEVFKMRDIPPPANDIVSKRNRASPSRHPAMLIETPRKGTVITSSWHVGVGYLCACRARAFTRVCVSASNGGDRQLAKPLFQQVHSTDLSVVSLWSGVRCSSLDQRGLSLSVFLSRENPSWQTRPPQRISQTLSRELGAISGHDGHQRTVCTCWLAAAVMITCGGTQHLACPSTRPVRSSNGAPIISRAGQLQDQTMKYRPGLECAIVIALLIGLCNPRRGLNDKISLVRITFH